MRPRNARPRTRNGRLTLRRSLILARLRPAALTFCQSQRHHLISSVKQQATFSRPVKPELCHSHDPLSEERRREDRAPAGTHGPRAAKKHAAEPQVQPNTSGLPCAMVLRLIRDLPGETGLCCHRCLASSRKAQHLHRGARTTRFRRPHHAVRLTTQRGHRIPLPTFVTIASAPLIGGGMRGSIVVICPTAQEKMCTTGSLRMAGMRDAVSASFRGDATGSARSADR
jgi:hypothetical protein